MNYSNLTYWGQTKYWWLVLIIGIAMIPCGFFYWIRPVLGYEIASMLFGWLLILAGCIQIAIGGNVNKVKGRGWWIAGGVLDIFIGFLMVRNLLFSETVLPYFLAFIFLYWGITSFLGAFEVKPDKYWWLQLINGLLLMIIGYFFFEGGFLANMETIDFLVSIAFIYWGISLCTFSFILRPKAG